MCNQVNFYCALAYSNYVLISCRDFSIGEASTTVADMISVSPSGILEKSWSANSSQSIIVLSISGTGIFGSVATILYGPKWMQFKFGTSFGFK
jgi:hypothetical protein